jgi:hypothetical protein
MIHSTLASRRLALRPVALAVALIAAGSALAQAQAAAPAAAAEASLPSVTVSASGLQLGAGDMTTPVTVLEGDELVRRREATLGETLSSEPGITSSHFAPGPAAPSSAAWTARACGAATVPSCTMPPPSAPTTPWCPSPCWPRRSKCCAALGPGVRQRRRGRRGQC